MAQSNEQGGGELRATYYNFSCPNKVHVFALLGCTDTCIYCYVNDNPPIDRKQHELDAVIKGAELVNTRLASHFDPNGEALTEHYEGQNIVEAFILELKKEREQI